MAEGPEGPGEICFGRTGAVTRIKGGQQPRVVTGLPSLAAPGGGDASGPSDVSFLGLGFLTVGLGAEAEFRTQLPPSASTLGHLWTFVPGASRTVPLAGDEASGNPDDGLPGSSPQPSTPGPVVPPSPTPRATHWSE